MRGGAGNDTYIVNSTDDIVDEFVIGSNGIDTVMSSVGFSLANINVRGDVENLTLTGTAINGTGNALDNVITGNGGVNVLDGGGGNDTLDGKGGNDPYYVDSAADIVIESANGGVDTVQTTTASYTLSNNVENLTFTGTGNFQGTGNNLDNTITGGTGNDSLYGGSGADRWTAASVTITCTAGPATTPMSWTA